MLWRNDIFFGKHMDLSSISFAKIITNSIELNKAYSSLSKVNILYKQLREIILIR